MPFSVACAKCGKVSTAPDEFEGKRGRCRQCGNVAVLTRRGPASSPDPGRVIDVSAWPDLTPPPVATLLDEPEPVFAPLRDFPEVEVDEEAVGVAAFLAVTVPAPRAAVPAAPATASPPAGTTACPFCAETIQAAAKKCKHCGEFLDPVLRAARESPAGIPQVVVNATASASIRGARPRRKKWEPAVAALLSFFFPGAGQMYRGQVAAGILWLIGVVLGYATLILPGFLLHLCCVVLAASGDPYG